MAPVSAAMPRQSGRRQNPAVNRGQLGQRTSRIERWQQTEWRGGRFVCLLQTRVKRRNAWAGQQRVQLVAALFSNPFCSGDEFPLQRLLPQQWRQIEQPTPEMLVQHFALNARIEPRHTFLAARCGQCQHRRTRLRFTTKREQQVNPLHRLIRRTSAQSSHHVRALAADLHRADPLIGTGDPQPHAAGIEAPVSSVRREIGEIGIEIGLILQRCRNAIECKVNSSRLLRRQFFASLPQRGIHPVAG